jgi:nitrite reductase/ring-hydroxylating ferredoxin subunit/uncharacterized membrane protein
LGDRAIAQLDDKAVTDAIDRQEWLGPVAETIQGAVGAAYKSLGPAGKPVEDVLNGVWLGHTLHPAVVTIPLGAWTAAAVMDVLEAGGKREYAAGADGALLVGLVGAAGAAVTGLTQYYPIQEESVQKVGASHALINGTATAAMLASYLIRRGGGDRGTARALGWLGWGLSMAGAYLGGSIAYQEHMGADHAERKGLPQEFTPVIPLAELPEDKPVHARAGEIDLVIVRKGQRLHALGGICSHYGGPLWEGEVKDGCISCPWHGSEFQLEDGKPCHGPATYAQPLFEARVRDGQVEVRAVPNVPQNRA